MVRLAHHAARHCTEIIAPDFSSLPEYGVPYRWELSDEELRAVVTNL